MSEDMWHVEIEPGDVKVVTLEQMDDMYRLDIIQGSTQVWQEGMPRALPLSVVAGIDESEEEEEEIMEIEPEPLDSAPVLSTAPPPARSTITPPPSASVVVSQPPPPPAPAMPTPDFYSPQSLRPITMSGAPQPAEGSGTGGRIVMVLAVAAGLVLTLYRNDVLADAAKSAGSESVYAKVESAVGHPGFGTTRSVEELASVIAPVQEEAPATTTTDSTATNTTDSPPAETVESATSAAEDDTKAKADDSSTKNEAAEKSTTRAPVRGTPRPVRKPAKKKNLKKFKGSEYDPMNASL